MYVWYIYCVTPNRIALELRRELAAEELRVGKLQSEVAKKYGVSRTSVSRWAKRLKKGESLESRKATGRPPRMTARQLGSLRKHVLVNDEAFSETQKWIKKTFGISYHVDHVSRIIRGLGITEEERGSVSNRSRDVRPVHAEPVPGSDAGPTAA